MTIHCRRITSELLDVSKQSRDISNYAYRRGAASLMNSLDAERTE
ncbi:MAG TPA: hypothetical protein VIH72_10125 [Candidatus Acidoferrales bacterium]